LAVRVPDAFGVNVTAIVQLLPAATLLPQGLGWESAKSTASVPEKVIALTVKADVPVLVSSTLFGALVELTTLRPKKRLVGTSMTVPVEIVMDAELNLLVSETDVAVSVTGPLAGTEAGAVKLAAVPLGVVAGETVPQAGEHDAEF